MMQKPHFLLLLPFLSVGALAELQVSTEFEGGNAEVVRLDQATKTLRIMPELHEGRGWPCWWHLKLDGLIPGEVVTLEVQAQTKPFRDKQVLAAAWCQPKHAWLSSDGESWSPSEAGTLSEDKVMRYMLKPKATVMYPHERNAVCASGCGKAAGRAGGETAGGETF